MTAVSKIRSHLTELLVVFVGVALAFAVDNYREERNERAVGQQYLSAFRHDLNADLKMLEVQHKSRQAQLKNAKTLLEFYDGRPSDPVIFFEAFWPVLWELKVMPNRNTIDEVLSSGSLRLIRDPKIKADLLSLYATYAFIDLFEEHMARDFDMYLYDPTFSSIKIQFTGPWKDTPESRQDVDTLLADQRVENGLRLIVSNLDLYDESFIFQLEKAKGQVEQLLQEIPEE
jgi:hypothetical protein